MDKIHKPYHDTHSNKTKKNLIRFLKIHLVLFISKYEMSSIGLLMDKIHNNRQKQAGL